MAKVSLGGEGDEVSSPPLKKEEGEEGRVLQSFTFLLLYLNVPPPPPQSGFKWGEEGGEEGEWVSPLLLPPSSSSLILFSGPHASLLHGEHGHGKKEVDGLGGTQSATKIVDTAAQLHPHKHVHKPPKRSV